jgi:hypothetical protein
MRLRFGFIVLATFGFLLLGMLAPGGTSESRRPTAPSPAQRLTFFVLGDPQLHEPFLRTIVARIAAERPDFVLIPGDLCMANGADPAPWDEFFDIFAPLYSRPNTTLYAVPGNHDLDGDFAAALRQWLERWDLPKPKVYYSFTRRSVWVAGLFVTRAALFRSPHERPPLRWPIPLDVTQSQIEWLREELAAIPDSIRWKILFHHEPGTRYARLSHPRDGPGSPGISGYVEPMAFDAGVDLIIRGHQHFYERTWPINIRTGRRDDERGMVMITTGGGNTAFRPEDPADAEPLWFDAVIALGRVHYCKATIEGHRLTWEAIALDGEVFDRFEIIKSPDGRRRWIGLPETSRLLLPPGTSPPRR